MTWSRSFGERSHSRGLWLGEKEAARLQCVAALGDWLVETHVSEVIVQATEACRQICSANVVFASFVVGLAVDARHRKRDCERVRDGLAEQALSSRDDAVITLAHL